MTDGRIVMMKRQNFEDTDDDFYEEINHEAKIGSPTQSSYTPDRKKRRGMIEKKRRDRINQCLSELKKLVPTAFEKQGSAKLEKAEILKMTVDHLKLLQTNQKINSSDQSFIASDLKREGFRECVSEVARYLVTFEGLDPQNPLCVRLLNHLHHHFSQHHHHRHHQNHHQELIHSSLPSSMPQLPTSTSAFSQLSQRLDYWNPPNGRRYLDSRNISNSKPLNSAPLVTSYFPPTSTILPYANHHQYYGNWSENERNTTSVKSDTLVQSYSSSTDGNSQQNERKDSGGFNLLAGALNPSDLGRPALAPSSTFDSSNSFSHSQLLQYLKPYRPWGTELALY